ncbi:hypothetical protein FPV67DRAFT_1544720 [Lyophyllum atratum]|nr:hypothetical protein FPV67DRAFT_1544720 [Lyophyllum atratum]
MHNVMLPHELIDYIIDHLHDDRAALCACCLACKAWLACSRYHLFADVLLDYRRFDDIHSLPQPSTFAVATRRLMLAGTNILPPGIQHFSSITSFYLRVSTPTADMVTQIPLLFSNITLLELNQVTFDSFEQMFQTICRCTALETLTVFAGLWKEESEQLAPGLCLPPHLHTLNILSSWLHIFLDWFNTLESLPPLTTMRLCGIGEPHMASVGTAIKSLGNSLQHLTLDLRDHRSTGPPFLLSPPNLR